MKKNLLLWAIGLLFVFQGAASGAQESTRRPNAAPAVVEPSAPPTEVSEEYPPTPRPVQGYANVTWIIRTTPFEPGPRKPGDGSYAITEVLLDYSITEVERDYPNDHIPLLLATFRHGETVNISSGKSRYFEGKGTPLSYASTWWAGGGDDFQIVQSENEIKVFHILYGEGPQSETKSLATIRVPDSVLGNIIFRPPVYQDKLNYARDLRVTSPRTYGDDVRYVQTLLKTGYSLDPGPIDGYYGPKTEAAVKQFQKNKGLTASGVVDKPTHWALINFGVQG